MPDARVYIWYPEGENIGHASMHIGDHQEVDDTNWYVSWWPHLDDDDVAGLTDTIISDPKTYDEDVEAEGGTPHVVYAINHLNINTMKALWDGIRTKPQAHYRLLPKNCSTIVARVLRAGGAGRHLNAIKELSYAHNAYWTPKNVAQFCNQLRDAGEAVKTKSAGCPTKGGSKLMVFLGLR
jgi:hypothetical protein